MQRPYIEFIVFCKMKLMNNWLSCLYHHKSFSLDKLDFIKRVEEVDVEIFNKELKIIADDIFNGRENSLAEIYI